MLKVFCSVGAIVNSPAIYKVSLRDLIFKALLLVHYPNFYQIKNLCSL